MLLILNRNNAISLIRTNSLIGTNYFLSGTGLFGLPRMYCTGFWGCFKREVPQCSFIHCMLHKQALAAKNLQPELHETLNLVIQVVNFVKSSPLNERILRKLCEDSEAEHDALLFHTEVRWLSRGKTLERVYSIYDQLCEFLDQKHFFKTEEFSSIYFRLKLAYLTEIFSYYNLSNLRL